MGLEINKLKLNRGSMSIGPISMEVEKGEIVTICGKNGSGKTSTLSALARDIPILSGNVIIDGTKMETMTIKQLSRKLSYVQQEIPEPMGFTVRDILEIAGFTRNGGKEEIKEALNLCGMESFIDREFSSLSGGEKRMVYIASGIYQNSDYIMLDEPTSYLDIDRIQLLVGILKKMKKMDRGILLVLHDINLAYKISNRILLMASGSSVAYGEASEVIREDVLPKAYDVPFSSYDSPEGKRFYPIHSTDSL